MLHGFHAAAVAFSNRPFRVKRFQAIHHYGVDVAHGLVLLFGIGTRGPSIMGFENEVEQSFGPCRSEMPSGPFRRSGRVKYASPRLAFRSRRISIASATT